MTKHTSLYLDEALLEEAEAVLGTSGPTGTIKAALEDVVRREHLKRLTNWEIALTVEQLKALRGSAAE